MALPLPIFPLDQPVMPEGRQIGRLPAIEELQRRIGTPANQWLIGRRRIGKTSVAKAVLARLRTNEMVALDIDITKLSISTQRELAGEIARQAQAAQVGAPRTKRALNFVGKQASSAAWIGKTLAELGFKNEGEALSAVSALLAGADGGEPGLDSVLEALALHARTTGQRVVILLDEIHLLAELTQDESHPTITGCEGTLARWAREEDCPIVFIFAGSEESAVRELRESGRPLASIGAEYNLPDIATEDWLHGLEARFQEAGVTVERGQLRAIVDASDGHPRRTMLVAHRVHLAAQATPDGIATETLVELAIRDAQKDRAWR